MSSSNRPIAPQGWPLLGSMVEARRDPLAFTLRLAREFGAVARFHLGPYKGYLVSHPEGVRHVLQANHGNYDKRNYDYDMLRPFLGEGLLTSDGAEWLRERRLIQPAFHSDNLSGFVASMNTSIQRMLDSWQLKARANEAFDVASEMNRLALEIVSKGLLGSGLGPRKERVLEAFGVLNHEVARRFQSLVILPLWMPTPSNLAVRRAKAEIDDVVMGFLSEAEQSSSEGALLRMLLEAHSAPSGSGVRIGKIRDEMVTLILAGHETTAALLSWTWYLLAQHSEAAKRVRAEARDVLAGRDPQAADLRKLVFTESVLKEALRLYPPVWIISRRAKQADHIQGYRIPADSVVALSPYATHRDQFYWDEPESFNPQRFMRARGKEQHPFAYFPFGGGPRLCIGGDFAMMEAKMVVASVVQRYRLELVGDEPVQPKALITLRPQGGLKMKPEPVGA